MTDWLPELIDDDLETLLEALEAWEDKNASTVLLGDVTEMVLGKGQSTEWLAQKDLMRREKVIRKERSVMLRAKLLTLRDRRRVERSVAP